MSVGYNPTISTPSDILFNTSRASALPSKLPPLHVPFLGKLRLRSEFRLYDPAEALHVTGFCATGHLAGVTLELETSRETGKVSELLKVSAAGVELRASTEV